MLPMPLAATCRWAGLELAAAHLRSTGHLQQVIEQSKAGDICAGSRSMLPQAGGCCLIGLLHDLGGPCIPAMGAIRAAITQPLRNIGAERHLTCRGQRVQPQCNVMQLQPIDMAYPTARFRKPASNAAEYQHHSSRRCIHHSHTIMVRHQQSSGPWPSGACGRPAGCLCPEAWSK